MNWLEYELLEAAASEDPWVMDDISREVAVAHLQIDEYFPTDFPEWASWFLLFVLNSLLWEEQPASPPRPLPAAEQVELEFFTHGGRLEYPTGGAWATALMSAPQLFLLLQDLMAGREPRPRTQLMAFNELINRGWASENPLSNLQTS